MCHINALLFSCHHRTTHILSPCRLTFSKPSRTFDTTIPACSARRSPPDTIVRVNHPCGNCERAAWQKKWDRRFERAGRFIRIMEDMGLKRGKKEVKEVMEKWEAEFESEAWDLRNHWPGGVARKFRGPGVEEMDLGKKVKSSSSPLKVELLDDDFEDEEEEGKEDEDEESDPGAEPYPPETYMYPIFDEEDVGLNLGNEENSDLTPLVDGEAGIQGFGDAGWDFGEEPEIEDEEDMLPDGLKTELLELFTELCTLPPGAAAPDIPATSPFFPLLACLQDSDFTSEVFNNASNGWGKEHVHDNNAANEIDDEDEDEVGNEVEDTNSTASIAANRTYPSSGSLSRSRPLPEEYMERYEEGPKDYLARARFHALRLRRGRRGRPA